MTDQKTSGGCLCGRTTYTISTTPKHLDFCYCKTCQELSGAPFIAWTGVPKESIEWHGEAPAEYRATVGDTGISVATRTFCGTCGSNLAMLYEVCPWKTHIAAGTIRRDSKIELPSVGCHIWCCDKPSWYEIPQDGVPKYDEFDEEFQGMLDQFLAKTKSEPTQSSKIRKAQIGIEL